MVITRAVDDGDTSRFDKSKGTSCSRVGSRRVAGFASSFWASRVHDQFCQDLSYRTENVRIRMGISAAFVPWLG